MIALIDALDAYGVLGPGPAFAAIAILIIAVAAASQPTIETNQ